MLRVVFLRRRLEQVRLHFLDEGDAGARDQRLHDGERRISCDHDAGGGFVIAGGKREARRHHEARGDHGERAGERGEERGARGARARDQRTQDKAGEGAGQGDVDRVHPQRRQSAEAEHHRLQQQRGEDGGKDRRAQNEAHQSAQQKVDARRAERNREQRHGEKACGEDRHPRQRAFVERAQRQGERAGRGEAAADENGHREHAVGNMRQGRASPFSAARRARRRARRRPCLRPPSWRWPSPRSGRPAPRARPCRRGLSSCARFR